MKKAILFIFLLNIIPNLFGQVNNIVDVFLLIPKEYTLETDLNKRKELVEFYTSSTSKIPEEERIPAGHDRYIKVIDTQNGYLSMTGSYLEGTWEMTYWNSTDTSKIIVVNYSVCQTSCWTNYLEIYKYSSKTGLKELALETVIPLQKIREYLLKDNLPKTQLEELFKKGLLSENYENIIFELPRKGKYIIGRFGWDDSNDKIKFQKNSSCELTLKNEAFFIKEY